jgi:glycosyltransferase involved in cell wall biosynthesis
MDPDLSIPLVSVVMPVYNAAPFLKQAIDSILQQTFTDFELIMINDGSTDASEKIIRNYTDKRIRYFDQANAGVAKTLNRGIALATGKYIWRHDADDISLPEKLQVAVQYLEKRTDTALCACQVMFMTEAGKVAKNFRQPGDAAFGNQPVMEITREKFNPYSPITHGTVLVRSDVMRELGGYRKEFVTGEDVDLWLRLIQKYKAVVLHQCLSLHRLSSASATQVHGWKNDFFRKLAFSFYDQRAAGGLDDLQKDGLIVLPQAPVQKAAEVKARGKLYRNDLLSYSYPLHMNAKDYKASLKMIRHALRDGWRCSQTWKRIFFPFIGTNNVKKLVKLKNTLSGTASK